MTQINPFTGSIVQAPQVQRSQATEKDRQLQKANALSKNAALQGDQLEHEVESGEAITPAHDEDPRKPPQRDRPRRRQATSNIPDDADESHLDVTA
jgi:hypothetical protein